MDYQGYSRGKKGCFFFWSAELSGEVSWHVPVYGAEVYPGFLKDSTIGHDAGLAATPLRASDISAVPMFSLKRGLSIDPFNTLADCCLHLGK
jgi:hypothetical protein